MSEPCFTSKIEVTRDQSLSFDPMMSSSQTRDQPAALKLRKNLQRLNMSNESYLRASNMSNPSLFKDIVNDLDLVGFTIETEIQIIAFWSTCMKFSSLLQEIFYNHNRQLMSDIEDDYENFHLFNDFKGKLNKKYTNSSILTLLSQRSSLLSVFLDDLFYDSDDRSVSNPSSREPKSKTLSKLSSLGYKREMSTNQDHRWRIVEAIEILL